MTTRFNSRTILSGSPRNLSNWIVVYQTDHPASTIYYALLVVIMSTIKSLGYSNLLSDEPENPSLNSYPISFLATRLSCIGSQDRSEYLAHKKGPATKRQDPDPQR